MNKPIDIKKEREKRAKQPPPAPSGLPRIEITTELYRVVDEANEALATDPDTYQREGHLVRVLRVLRAEKKEPEDTEPSSKKKTDALEGTPVIRPVVTSNLRETLTRVATWAKYDSRKDALSPCLPSSPVVEALLERGEWKGIRPITGIAETPMFLDNGSIVDSPGYNSRSGYLYAPTCEFPKVPEHPTQDDARRAFAELQDVFVDFPWCSPSDAAVPIAMILSSLARPAINNVPAFLFDANQKGSGKSLIVDAVMMILTGRCAPKQGYTADPTEQEKVLGAYALEGASFVTYDNIKQPFGGAPVELTLTCGGSNKFRILGVSQVPEQTWKGIISATGNNIVLCGDVARRVLLSRIETDIENPENRTGFAHDPLLSWVLANRGRLVVAGLTMLRAWHLDGRKSHGCNTLGSFEEWAATIPPAIVFAGGADPMACLPANIGEETEEKTAHRALLYWWPQIAPNGATVKAVLAELYPNGKPNQSDSYDALREALESLSECLPGRIPETRKLGEAMSSLRGQVIDGLKLTCPDPKQTKSAKSKKWRVVPVGHRPRASQPGPSRNDAHPEAGGQGGHGGSFSTTRALSVTDTLGEGDTKRPPATPLTPHLHPDDADPYNDGGECWS